MKNEFAAEICAVLAFSAIKNNDRVGLVIVTDQVEKVVVPKKGRKHVLRVIRELLFHVPEHKGTSLSVGLEYVLNILNRKSVLFVVSDFLDTGYERPLRVAASRHDVILMRITDPRELELPDVGLVRLTDPETGRTEVRVVNIDSFTYRSARRFMVRLEGGDFQDQQWVEKLASCTNLTPDQFVQRFGYLGDVAPRPF